MEKLATDYAPRGVQIVGIKANSTEPIEEVKQHAADKGLTFIILKDKGNRIADRFDAQVTPEAYLLDASGSRRRKRRRRSPRMTLPRRARGSRRSKRPNSSRCSARATRTRDLCSSTSGRLGARRAARSSQTS